jgi:D-alanyl-D-alanine-carboxypeptidase/D-alanyl-D-alanine-endopeptidase
MTTALIALAATMPLLSAPAPQVSAEAYVHSRITPAVGIARLDGDGVQYGVAGQEPVSADALFAIGSVTKVFTALLLADAVARGEVTYESTVGELLPEWGFAPEVSRITLLQLATHTSGLPRLPRESHILARVFLRPGDPYAGLTVDDLFEDLSRVTSDAMQGQGRFNYSNFGSAVLGRLLEARAGRPYEVLMRERVLLPLGLEGMGFLHEVKDRPELMPPHRDNLRWARHWQLGAYEPMGGLYGSLEHMVRFLQAAMVAEEGSPMAETVERGLGWARSERDGVLTVWHNGRVGGYYSYIGFRPDSELGVVVLSNAAHDGDGFARSLFDGPATIPMLSSSWMMIGFTVLFTLLGPVLLYANIRQPTSRIHGLESLVSTVFLLALVFRLGAWTTIPFVVWWIGVGASLFGGAMLVRPMITAPWTLPGRPWTTAGKVVSMVFMIAVTAWALFRL